MQKKLFVKVMGVFGLAGMLGLGWALASPHLQQQPPVEIPLYEGAQIELEVQLAAQEMPKQLAQWAQALSVLKVAGYSLEGERSLEVLSFYDRVLSDWQRVLWVQPYEPGGVRLLRKGQSYLFIAIARRYEATDLFIATAQADESPLDVPLFEGADLQWEVLLTSQDFLEHLKRWLKNMITNLPPSSGSRTILDWSQPWWPLYTVLGVMGWVGGSMIFELVQDLSELRAVLYQVESEALDVLNFYEKQFSQWQRNLWIKPDESGSIRVFTRSEKHGLQELMLVATLSTGERAVALVLRARR